MKCTRCHGTGKITEWVATDTVSEYEFPCRKCNGTGEIALTNEEWFCQLSTEEKADFFCTVQHCLTIYGDHIATIEDWKKWLKEKHDD